MITMLRKLITITASMSAVQAHMHLHYPPALGGDNNRFTIKPDPLLNYPYGCCEKDFAKKNWDMGPCHGHISKLNTDEGRPVTIWKAGQSVEYQISGQKLQGHAPEFQDPSINVVGGNHYGGSCQAGLSFDGGKTFHTVGTWQGNCPLRDSGIEPSNQRFSLTLPNFLPSEERAFFAWTWVNREHEFFMNCASVSIQGSHRQAPNPNPQSDTSKPTIPTSSAGSSPPSLMRLHSATPTQQSTKRHAPTSVNDLPPMQLGFIRGCNPSTLPTLHAVELEFSDPGDLNVHNATDGEFKRMHSFCANVLSFR